MLAYADVKMHSQYFKDIPAEIGRLTALTLLNLQHCALVELPGMLAYADVCWRRMLAYADV